MESLLKALIKAKQNFEKITKDKLNPHYKTPYASLDSILSAVSESLHNNGLVIVQTLTPDGRENGQSLVTTLYHESGNSISETFVLPIQADIQKLGAAITYARRYSICCILGVTAEDAADAVTPSKSQATSTKLAEGGSKKAYEVIQVVSDLLGGVPVAEIKEAIVELGKQNSAQLTDLELGFVIRKLSTNWGYRTGAYEHIKHALNSYDKNTKENPGVDYPEVVALWIEKTLEKISTAQSDESKEAIARV